jgi:hypothetical protein
MRFKFTLLIAAVLAASLAWAAPYGNNDALLILSTTDTPTGKRHGIDLPYLDRMLADIASRRISIPNRTGSVPPATPPRWPACWAC